MTFAEALKRKYRMASNSKLEIGNLRRIAMKKEGERFPRPRRCAESLSCYLGKIKNIQAVRQRKISGALARDNYWREVLVWIGGREVKEIGRIRRGVMGALFMRSSYLRLRGHKGSKYTERCRRMTMWSAQSCLRLRDADTAGKMAGGRGRRHAKNKAAGFVESCMEDIQSTWVDTISEILSFLTYGWSFHEIVYKRRMGHTKGRPYPEQIQ